MKLLIHVGTEKTGSSYLQKLCGRNREFLQKNGIWFPSAGKDEKMLQQHTISPGNAQELVEIIGDMDWAKVSSWIASRVEEAQKRECADLLLSNEILFAALASAGAVSQFQSAATKAGIDESSSLLMIRDPIDQALSLYKHRAKCGTAGEIEKWLATGYFLPKQVSDFLGQIDDSDVQLHMRKYSKQTESILGMFFHDWLEVETPPNQIEERVNPSLSLSELEVIRHVVVSRPADQPAFYSKFLAVPQAEKALDTDIEKFAAMKVERFLIRFDDVWNALNERLSTDGGIKLPRARDFDQVDDVDYAFSEAQIRAWSEAHSETFGIRYWFSSRIRPRIGKLIQRILSQIRGG